MSGPALPDGRELVVAVGGGFQPGSGAAQEALRRSAEAAVARAASFTAFGSGLLGDLCGPRWSGERAVRAVAEGVAPFAPYWGGSELAVAAFETGSAVYVVLSAVPAGWPPRRGESRVRPWVVPGAP